MAQGQGPSGIRPSTRTGAATPALPVDGYTIVRRYPHDANAFTEGLQFVDGFLYEGTGIEGESTLRKVDLETGQVLKSRALDPQHFGEGIVVFGDEIFQLTYTSGKGFVYQRDTFEPCATFTYSGEGWGLTHDGKSLIMSDGTAQLRFLDPQTLREQKRMTVKADGKPVDQLNELEFVKGEILANIFMTDKIARIDPKTGAVKGYIDLKGLRPDSTKGYINYVLNGIAYDATRDRLYVTGKNWPELYEIQIVPKGQRVP